MKQLKQRFGSIYSEDEERVLGPWQRIRQYLLAPIAVILSRMGISPDMLSYTSVAFGIGFFLLAPFHFAVAFWLLVASIICDSPGNFVCLCVHFVSHLLDVASYVKGLITLDCASQPHAALYRHRTGFLL